MARSRSAPPAFWMLPSSHALTFLYRTTYLANWEKDSLRSISSRSRPKRINLLSSDIRYVVQLKSWHIFAPLLDDQHIISSTHARTHRYDAIEHFLVATSNTGILFSCPYGRDIASPVLLRGLHHRTAT